MDHQISTLREEAEFFRLTIAMGLLGPSDAVAWADRTIMALDMPPIELINVSLAGNKSPIEMMDLLASIPGPADLTASAHRALRLLRDRLDARLLTSAAAAKTLDGYRSWAFVSEHELRHADSVWYLLQDVQGGFYGTMESVGEELIDFLNRTLSGESAECGAPSTKTGG